MSEGASYPFEVTTPLGFSVRTTADYWLLLEAKHPKLRGRAQDVAQVLAHPDQVYQSRQDRAVFLYYRTDQRRLLRAVVKRLDGEGFLITAYPCDKIKEGDRYMAHIRVIHDPIGETLTVYWDNPEYEEVCEEVGQGIILIKDARGGVIGFERLYFKPSTAPNELGVVLQTART